MNEQIINIDKNITNLNPKKQKVLNRIWELDFLRGICILLMVFDHSMFGVFFIFNDAWTAVGSESITNFVTMTNNYWVSPLRLTVQPIVLWTLFMLCGVSCSFSRSNLKRGIQLFAVALVITYFTIMFEKYNDLFEGMSIRYGVLHMLASCILIWWFIFTCTKKNKYATATICFMLSLVILILSNHMGELTANYTATNNNWAFLAYELAEDIGTFSPGDFFPLIPNLGMFLLGAAIGPVLYNTRRSLVPQLDVKRWYRPINFFGRHTLEIVVLHQIIIEGLLALISFIFITKGDFVIF